MLTHVKTIFVLTLLIGLITAELLLVDHSQTKAAYSGRNLTAQEQAVITSILDGEDKKNSTPSALSQDQFLYFDIANPNQIDTTQLTTTLLLGTPVAPPTTGTPSLATTAPPSASPQNYDNIATIIDSILPPTGSPLALAYSNLGRAFYQKGDNLLVIYPNESLASFSVSTGQSTTWLQKYLTVPPITNDSAYYRFLNDYKARVVAESNSWSLIEFPSGAILRAVPPTAAFTSSSANNLYGLPDVLPGYQP